MPPNTNVMPLLSFLIITLPARCFGENSQQTEVLEGPGFLEKNSVTNLTSTAVGLLLKIVQVMSKNFEIQNIISKILKKKIQGQII